MNTGSAIAAMLWENWRLTRIEAAQRLVLGILAGWAALAMFGASVNTVFWILVPMHAFFYMSIAKLNGGRFIDGYKPGFPLYLYYTRPVSTGLFVGVAMAYDAFTCTAMYVVSAALLGFVSDKPLPVFSMALFLVTFHLVYLAIQWSTRNRVVQWIGSIAISLPPYLLLLGRTKSLPQVEFSLAENAAMVLVCVVSVCVAIAGVARQRRGDAVASVPQAARSAGYPDWLVSLLRFPCPTSSATRAQIWFELQSSGFPILLIGLAISLLVFVLYTLGIAIAPLRPAAVAAPIMFGLPALLLVFGSNAFGIRQRQGRTYASTFESTQPYRAAQMAWLKIGVRAACVLAAMIAVVASVWLAGSILSAWGPWVFDNKDVLPELLKTRHKLGNALVGQTGYSLAMRVLVVSTAVAGMIAFLATFAALRARYPRRTLVAISLVPACITTFLLLAWAQSQDVISQRLLVAIVSATGWIAAAALVLGMAYLAWRVLAERLLTPRQAGVIVLVLAVFATAWLLLLRANGVSLAGMPAVGTVAMLWPALLLLIFTVLAPWSLSRIRHT